MEGNHYGWSSSGRRCGNLYHWAAGRSLWTSPADLRGNERVDIGELENSKPMYDFVTSFVNCQPNLQVSISALASFPVVAK